MVTAEAELKQDLDEVLDFLLSNEPSLATRANAVLVKALVLFYQLRIAIAKIHHNYLFTF